MKSKPITRFTENAAQKVDDFMAIEEPLQIRIHQHNVERNLAITMRTPGDDIALAAGFLFSEALLGDFKVANFRTSSKADNVVTVHLSDAHQMDWKKLERHNYTSSSCGVCGKTSLEQVFNALPFSETPSNWQVSTKTIISLPDRLRAAQLIFAKTGGIHAAGRFSLTGELLDFAEDVGRHNALDKLIGKAYLTGNLPLDRTILVLSGRSSFELIQKAAMAGFRLVIAVGAPSSLAVSLAEDQGITLCGFVKSTGFNCYTHPERIIVI